MTNLGFSTGALAKGDFVSALKQMANKSLSAVELSALRVDELPHLMQSLKTLDLHAYRYVSVHAPSSFSAAEESRIVELLQACPKNWKIVLHPDAIKNESKWLGFGSQLVLENMDRRKLDGRTAEELGTWFERLPEAMLCVDLAHAQQWDTTMTEAYLILTKFRNRICEIHISELDASSHHFPLSNGSIKAFAEIASLIPRDAAVIIESRVDEEGMQTELEKARSALTNVPETTYRIAVA
jgi:hypothetical protein